ncbi:MAG TPA: NHL repeat-containing protein [Candidatus Brocadiia bacterium]|nr:NHL repeat-containing protein [Candidatus Brocadiales bacterium]
MARQTAKIILYSFLFPLVTYCHASAEVIVPDGFAASIFASEITNPDGLTFDFIRNLYAAKEIGNYNGGISRIDENGGTTSFVNGLSRADGLVFDALTGLIYVSEEVVPGRVSKIDTNGNISVIVPESMVNNPEGIALNPLNGNLYIAEDTNPGRVLIYEPTSGSVTTFLLGLHRPEGITLDDLGTLYIAETVTNRILKVTPDANVSVLVPESAGIIEPDNILFDNTTGLLFVTEDASPDGRILIVDPASGLTTTFASGLSSPQGMAFDSTGNLYVSEQGFNRIIKITGFKCCSAIINNGAQYTTKGRVTLFILFDRDATNIRFSNDGTNWTKWRPASHLIQWRIRRGEGLKTIFIQCKKSGEICEPTTASITLKR